jgi:hypothetical protein
MVERSRALVVVLAVLGAACGPGCGAKGEGAAGQYRRVLDALQAGSLVEAYEAFLPASYDRDLNDVISGMRALIGKEELALVRDLVTRSANGAAVVFSTMGSNDPALAGLGAKVKELPAALGLDSLESFQRLDARAVLAALERTLFRDLVKVEGVRSKIASVQVRLVEERGDWSKLRFSLRDGDGAAGGVREELVDVILKDGKWVPASWIAEWPRQMESLKAQVRSLAEAKTRNPRAVLESLELASAALGEPGKLMQAILGGAGGGKPPPR